MKRFAMALALMCALSTSIFAGDMPSSGAVGQPSVSGITDTPPAAGDIQLPGIAGETQGPSLLETVILTIITWP